MMILLKVLKQEVNANGMKRVKKSTKFLLNLEKTKARQGTVKKLEINNKEIDNCVEINKELEMFSVNLFKRKHVCNKLLRDISLPTLSQEKSL